MNISALLAGAQQIAGHPVAKGGALASLITAGLYAAMAAGVSIPPVAIALGPIAGYVLYKVLPVKQQNELDTAVDDITSVVTAIPTTYSDPDKDFPTGKNGASAQAPISAGAANTNINHVS